MLQQYGVFFPSDFKRRGRGLNDVDRWTATELRTFISYVLKDFLPVEYYKHFLLLHFAIYSLCSSDYLRLFKQAESCLMRFVVQFSRLYGDDQQVYNVHCLTHSAKATLEFGRLDLWSCFPFENHLFQVKRRIRGGQQFDV